MDAKGGSMRALVYLILAVVCALISGVAFDERAVLENTHWAILALRWFFFIAGGFASGVFGCFSILHVVRVIDDL